MRARPAPPDGRLSIEIGPGAAQRPPVAEAAVDADIAELARRLGATTMFSSLPRDRLAALLAASLRQRCAAGDTIGGADGLRPHLVLLSGEVAVDRAWTAPDGGRRHHERRIGVAADGPGFALVSAAGHGLHVRALTAVEHLAVDADALDHLLGWTHLGAFVLPEPHLKVFHLLPLENVASAIRCLTERRVAAGETVVRAGDAGDAYYVLLSGEADVFEADPATGQPLRVNRLADGDSFGEESLLTGAPRTATVTMTTPGELLVLGRADFDRLVRPPMVPEVDADSARREVGTGLAQWLDCRSPAEFAEGRIDGARSMPLDRLRHAGAFELDPDARYVVYCRNGRRSRAAAFLLHERGIQASSLVGGITGWPFGIDDTPA